MGCETGARLVDAIKHLPHICNENLIEAFNPEFPSEKLMLMCRVIYGSLRRSSNQFT